MHQNVNGYAGEFISFFACDPKTADIDEDRRRNISGNESIAGFVGEGDEIMKNSEKIV